MDSLHLACPSSDEKLEAVEEALKSPDVALLSERMESVRWTGRIYLCLECEQDLVTPEDALVHDLCGPDNGEDRPHEVLRFDVAVLMTDSRSR